ncbi:KRAB-A domain-containing protein [Trichinella pseudospiralis]
MTYLNHFTKFCILSPLKSKRAEVVASKLLEIFVTLLSQHSAIRQRSRIFKCHNFRTQNMLAELKLVTCTPRVDVRFVHGSFNQNISRLDNSAEGQQEPAEL